MAMLLASAKTKPFGGDSLAIGFKIRECCLQVTDKLFAIDLASRVALLLDVPPPAHPSPEKAVDPSVCSIRLPPIFIFGIARFFKGDL